MDFLTSENENENESSLACLIPPCSLIPAMTEILQSYLLVLSRDDTMSPNSYKITSLALETVSFLIRSTPSSPSDKVVIPLRVEGSSTASQLPYYVVIIFYTLPVKSVEAGYQNTESVIF